MDTFHFQLESVLQYSEDGEYSNTGEIEFLPPSINCFKDATKLTQYVTKALLSSSKFKDLGESSEDIEEQEIDAQAVKFILMASDGSFNNIFDCFKKLSQKCGKLSEKTFLKETHFKKISYEDSIRMVCEYIANFIIPSLILETSKEGD
ncbi:MAG: hypothetical protein GY834_09950 [Bacteroidetes bacterium]|nr:hypothetical protein [Bacteroidota bacterium]